MGNPLLLIDPDGREPNDEWKRTIFPNGYVVTEWVSNKGGNEVDYLTTQDMRKTWGDAIKTENLSVRIAQNNGEIRQNDRYEPGLRYDGSPKSGAMEGVDMTDMVPTKAAFAKVGAWSVIKGIAAYRLAKTLLASKADDVTEAVVKKVLKPEAKYLGAGKHGIKWTEGSALAKKGVPQGQWGSLEDLEFAAQKAATTGKKGGYFKLPEGSKSMVHLPDGTTVPATHIWVRDNMTGTFHGYPCIVP